MTRKIDPEKDVEPTESERVEGIEGRSKEDEAEFEHDGKLEQPADVTEAQRELERK